MDGHEDMKALASGYVLNALEPDEAAGFERHLDSCAECWDAVAEYRSIRDRLPLTTVQVEPPPELRARVLAAVNAEASPRAAMSGQRRSSRQLAPFWSRLRMGPLASGAAAVLAVALIGVGWGVVLQDRLETSESRLSSLYDSMTVLAQADQRWEFSGAAIEPEAHGVFAYSSEHEAGILIVWGLPPETADRQYVAWTVSDEDRQMAGNMRWVNDGLWTVVSGEIDSVDGLGISVRDEHGQAADVMELPLAR
ncbi:MAG: anti-sigma factor [Dehalococcoidia bacterium]